MTKKLSKGQRMDNSLTQLVAGVRVASMLTGGSYLSAYNTISYSNNYSLITLNRIILTFLFAGNGIFQTAIQLPIQDALSKGIEIDSSEMSPDETDQLLEWMETPFSEDIESFSPWEVLSNTFTWVRLFGGGGSIINNGENPEIPFKLDSLFKGTFLPNFDMYDIDRWQMDYGAYLYRDDLYYNDWIDRDYFWIHGIKIHKSRILRSRGKRAPYYIRRQLRGWGMSEGERMIRDLNLFLKTQDVLYEIIDEAKVDVYKIKNLANKLLQRGGTEKIQNRILIANQLKNYLNALILDIEEEYQQKTMTFTGVAEVMRENRMNVASALRIPMTKLFGLSASGFNTGESDLENYNSMVESEVRTPIRPLLRRYLEIGCALLFGYVPSFKFTYPSLRVLSATDEENVKNSQCNRTLSIFDRGIIDSQELAQIGSKEGWISIKTKAEQGLMDAFPTPPNEGKFITEPSVSVEKTEKGFPPTKEEGQ